MKLIEKCKCPNNGLFIAACFFLIVFLLAEITIRIFNLYKDMPVVDVPSHIFAGMAIGSGIYWITTLTKIKRKNLAALLFALLFAFFWEILETLQELVMYNPPYLVDLFFWDGVGDIVATFFGAVFALGVIYILKHETNLID